MSEEDELIIIFILLFKLEFVLIIYLGLLKHKVRDIIIFINSMSQPNPYTQSNQPNPSNENNRTSENQAAQAQNALNFGAQMSRGRQNYNPSANYNGNNEVIDRQRYINSTDKSNTY